MLTDRTVTLRELKASDAPSLLAHVASPSVLQYMAPSPTSVDGFRRFIRWTQVQRRRGAHICFGIVPAGRSAPVGLIQVWPIEPDFSTCEWGFVVGESVWGTGLFATAARLVLDFAFATLEVSRLEARAVDANVRGNGALRKLGATPEGTLRRGFKCGESYRDYVMWSIQREEWTATRQRQRTGN